MKSDDEHYDIKILKDGTWLYGGTPINRINMVKLFASVLKRDEKGDFWLQTPYEKGRITVENAPFLAVEMKAGGAGKGQVLHFRTNLDQWVAAGAGHDLRFENGVPYVHVRDGLEAQVSRAVFYELAKLAEGGGVWSGGKFYPLETS
jgi:hypothetical protein